MLLCYFMGGLPLTYPMPSLHGRRAVWRTCLRIQIGITNQHSCLFVRVLWQIQKSNQSTKLFLWSGCSGDCGLKWKSDCSKRGGAEKPLTQCIVTHLKTSPCSLNVLLRVLTGQSTGNARIRYILIRAHKTLSRMLCCPGECRGAGTLTNSRSVSPLHHCEKRNLWG